jgi:FKBP-type peptidyl-prolyl cis-trans isomerase
MKKTMLQNRVVRHAVQGGAVVATLTGIGLAAMAAQGAYRVYYANDEFNRNVVMIVSDAPLETMLIRTGNVTAEVKVDPTNALNDPQARFVVDLASLETGIKARDEIMRGKDWLNVAQFPKATFKLRKLLGITRDVQILTPNQTRRFKAEGDMDLHGVTKTVMADVEVTPLPADDNTAQRLPGDLLRIKATFPIKLDDFGIAVAAPAKLKIANEESVTVNVFASTGSKVPEGAQIKADPVVVAAADNPGGKRKMANGLEIEDVAVGTGAEAKAGDTVSVHYTGKLTDGTQFDSSVGRGPFNFQLGAGMVIQGWDQGVAGMKVGGKRKLTIPPELGYGARGFPGAIPPNSTLVFDVELLKVN